MGIGIKAGIQNVFTKARHAIGIQTKAEKKLAKEMEQAALALQLRNPKADEFVIKASNGELVKVTQKDVDEINKSAADTLQRAGIRDIEKDDNYNRHKGTWNGNGWD